MNNVMINSVSRQAAGGLDAVREKDRSHAPSGKDGMIPGDHGRFQIWPFGRKRRPHITNVLEKNATTGAFYGIVLGVVRLSAS